MKYLFTLIFLIMLVLPSSGCAAPETAATQESIYTISASTTESTNAATATTVPIKKDGNSFIWKVSSGINYVYLLGSIHAGKADIYPLDGAIENAFEDSDKLVVEVNISGVDEMELASQMLAYAAYPPGEGLKANLPEDVYTRVSEQFEAWGIPLAVLDGYRPWLISVTMETMAMQEAGYTEEDGIDLHFLDRATDRGMEILEMETAEYQFQVLSSVPDELMVLVLEMSLEEPLTVADVELMYEVWEGGDAEGLEALLFESLVAEPALAPYYDKLFTERNYSMLEKIDEFLADDDIYFIVVGAGHLVGKEGLLSLLEEKGYTLEQLEN